MPEYQPRATNLPDEPFLRAYLECAEWCGIMPIEDDNGESDQERFETSDSPKWADHAINQATLDCNDFRVSASNHGSLLDDVDEVQAGHDFYLTRNHHGAGFWDRGLGEIGDKLTKLCKPYGEVNVWFDHETETLSFD